MLDLSIKKHINAYKENKFPPYSSFEPSELRHWFNSAFYKKVPETKITISKIIEKQISVGDSKLKIRLYYPEGTGKFPAMMYFHGGGFVIRDDMNIYDQTCRLICNRLSCVVVAVNFRLAPENPFPAAPEDCYGATCWIENNADQFDIDRNKIGVWGESCGGNLATVVSMMSRNRSGPAIKCQVIVTAMLDLNFKTLSYIENGSGDYFLTEDSMRWFWRQYIKNEADKKNPYCVPVCSEDLTGLPPSLLVTVEYDPLRDEGEKYAKQLQGAGVKTEYVNYPGLIHGFFDLTEISKLAKSACEDILKKAKLLLNA